MSYALNYFSCLYDTRCIEVFLRKLGQEANWICYENLFASSNFKMSVCQ